MKFLTLDTNSLSHRVYPWWLIVAAWVSSNATGKVRNLKSQEIEWVWARQLVAE